MSQRRKLKEMLHELIDQMEHLEMEQSADAAYLPMPYPEHPKFTAFGMFVTIRGYVRKELPKEIAQFVRR